MTNGLGRAGALTAVLGVLVCAAARPEKDERQVIHVATPEEFVAAIGPDRVIELTGKEYVLTGVKDRKMAYVRWDEEFDGKTLTIRNVKNLKIVAAGKEPARLIVHPSYVFVLNFDACEGVELANLVLGHAPEKGACTCGVVGMRNCADMTIRNCDLFGSGTEGLTLEEVKKLTVTDTTIRDCSYGIMSLKACETVTFSNCRLTGNEEFYGIDINDSEKVRFDGCLIENNKAAEALVKMNSRSDVTLKGGAIRNNRAKALSNNVGLKLENVEQEKNEFGKKKD